MSITEELHPRYVIDQEGRRKAVLLPVEECEELSDDLSDLAVAVERKEEKLKDQHVREY